MATRQLVLLAAVTLGCDPPDAGSDPPADACGSVSDAPLEPDGGGGQPLVLEGPCPAEWPLVASRIRGSGATWRLGLDDHDAPWLVDGDWLVRVHATARDCISGICTAIDECLPLSITSTADSTTPGIFALSPNYAIAIDDPDDELAADEITLAVDIVVPEEVAGDCVADVRLNGGGPQAVLVRSSPWQPVPAWPTTWAMASRGCEGRCSAGPLAWIWRSILRTVARVAASARAPASRARVIPRC
jgi:hypothetical protein